MTYFDEFNIDKASRIGITNVFSTISTKLDSHKGGWAKLLKCDLVNSGYKNVKILDKKDELKDFHVIIFDLGAEFNGSINLFGGLDLFCYKRFYQIKDYRGRMFSWKNKLDSDLLYENVLKRRYNKSSFREFKTTGMSTCQEFRNSLRQVNNIEHITAKKSLLIGDSHTPCFWLPHMNIERRDGRTLSGAIKNNTLDKILSNYSADERSNIKNIYIQLSSIDVRHHWCCPENCVESQVEYFAGRLLTDLVKLKDKFSLDNVYICESMGIEDESRKIPKSGWYNNRPFTGSWADRNKARETFNEIISNYCGPRSGFYVIKYPGYFFDETKKLKFDVMESPQSVHISPRNYMWNLDDNKPRWP